AEACDRATERAGRKNSDDRTCDVHATAGTRSQARDALAKAFRDRGPAGVAKGINGLGQGRYDGALPLLLGCAIYAYGAYETRPKLLTKLGSCYPSYDGEP